MPFVIREHPTFIERLNGIKFEPHTSGSISAEIDEVTAAGFLSVPGHRIAEDHEVPGYVAPVETPPAVVEKPAPAAPKTPRKTAAKAGANAATKGNETEVTAAGTDGNATAVTVSQADQAESATGPAPVVDGADSEAAAAADASLF